MSDVAEPGRIGVIILNWNGLALTRACLHSLRTQSHRSFEIHLVDNGSANDEADTLRREFGDEIRMHAMADNLGFAGGCNVALEVLLQEGRCEFTALLNNDTEVDPDWLAELLAAAQEPCVGAVASCMRLFAQPELLDGAGVWLLSNGDSSPRGRLQPVDRWQQAEDVSSACGGAVLLRCEMLREIGLFRTDFFANFEDMDLCLRATVAGYRIRYAPRASVRHHLNASIVRVRNHAFDVRSVRNATWATFVNLPWQVLLLNLPGFVVSNLAIIVLMPLAGRPGVSLAFLHGRLRALRELPAMLQERRRIAPLRRQSWWRMWRQQRSFVREYASIVWRRIRSGRSTIMARSKPTAK